jgi:imidazole glycerol-phosphate synthase subunit HisH
MPRITVFDYEAGNLHSLLKAIDDPARGWTVRVETDARALLRETDVLVLPGVGAFGHATTRLEPGRGNVAAALRDGLPAVGICLGMQLLCGASDEGSGEGLGLVPGRVRKLRARRVPQIGWNSVEWKDGVARGDNAVILSEPQRGESKDLDGGEARDPSTPRLRRSTQDDLPIAYYANGYVCSIDPRDPCVLATSTHESDRFAAVVRIANTVGMQFHPEKSSTAGVTALRETIAALLTTGALA